LPAYPSYPGKETIERVLLLLFFFYKVIYQLINVFTSAYDLFVVLYIITCLSLWSWCHYLLYNWILCCLL